MPGAYMSEIFSCARAIVGACEVRDFSFVVEAGKIVDAGAAAEVVPVYPDVPARRFGEQVIVTPGFVNGHSHAYQILLRGWGDDLSFATWRSEALYRIIPKLSPQDIYHTFVVAFTEMLAAGITTVAEFFYLNGSGNEHARAAIRAASDTGIRLIFARTWMDAPNAPAAFRESIGVARSRTAELLDEYPEINLCVAPHSLHAASPEMIAAAWEFARERDLLVHMHLAEAAYEGEQTQQKFGATPVMLLQHMGLLDERLVAVHAIYLSVEEKKRLAAAGARVVHNPMTNQYLGDGTCDVPAFLKFGARVGLGTDANVKPSLLEEMRAAAFLQKLAACDGAALDARTAFELGTSGGAAAVGLAAGDLAPGSYADFNVIRAAGIDAWSPAVNALVYRGQDAWIAEVYVAGKPVWNGRPPMLVERAKAELAILARSLSFGGNHA